MDKNKLVLPVSILLASVILGSFYFAGEVYKQQSIEKQQQMDQQAKIEQARKLDLYTCIASVDNKWASYIESVKGTPQASQFWNGITPAQQSEIDNCNKAYK